MGGNKAHPHLPKRRGRYSARAKPFHRAQPNELQVKVIVRQRVAGLCRKALHIQIFALALIRAAKRTADILTDPCGIDLIAILFHC